MTANYPLYPFEDHLREMGCRFYPDEAYCGEEETSYANLCDGCGEPAQYMTCDETDAYYVCQDCVERGKLTDLVDKEDV